MEGKSWSPNLVAGPYLSFLMSADLEGKDMKDAFAGTDFGLVFGGGFDFWLSEGAQVLSLNNSTLRDLIASHGSLAAKFLLFVTRGLCAKLKERAALTTS